MGRFAIARALASATARIVLVVGALLGLVAFFQVNVTASRCPSKACYDSAFSEKMGEIKQEIECAAAGPLAELITLGGEAVCANTKNIEIPNPVHSLFPDSPETIHIAQSDLMDTVADLGGHPFKPANFCKGDPSSATLCSNTAALAFNVKGFLQSDDVLSTLATDMLCSKECPGDMDKNKLCMKEGCNALGALGLKSPQKERCEACLKSVDDKCAACVDNLTSDENPLSVANIAGFVGNAAQGICDKAASCAGPPPLQEGAGAGGGNWWLIALVAALVVAAAVAAAVASAVASAQAAGKGVTKVGWRRVATVGFVGAGLLVPAILFQPKLLRGLTLLDIVSSSLIGGASPLPAARTTATCLSLLAPLAWSVAALANAKDFPVPRGGAAAGYTVLANFAILAITSGSLAVVANAQSRSATEGHQCSFFDCISVPWSQIKNGTYATPAGVSVAGMPVVARASLTDAAGSASGTGGTRIELHQMDINGDSYLNAACTSSPDGAPCGGGEFEGIIGADGTVSGACIECILAHAPVPVSDPPGIRLAARSPTDAVLRLTVIGLTVEVPLVRESG